MNLVLVTVLREGKVVFELEEEDRIGRRTLADSDEQTISFTVRPSSDITDLLEMPHPLFMEILNEVERIAKGHFGDDFKLLRFAFFRFSRCLF